jgi:hypothetical protein
VSVHLAVLKVIGKRNFYPRTGHEGPEGEQKYSSTFSLTSALDGVVGQRHALVALPLGKRHITNYSIRC